MADSTTLDENTFDEQAAVYDENSGAADIAAIGGSAGSGTAATENSNDSTTTSMSSGATAGTEVSSTTSKLSLTAAKAKLMEYLSKKPNGTLFKDGKFVFPSDFLKETQLKALVDGIQDGVASGDGLTGSLTNGINAMLSALKSQYQNDLAETLEALGSAKTSFLNTIKSKLEGMILSRVYVPDVAFLAGLYPLAKIGSNIAYKSHYVRQLCIKHDMPLSLKYVDSLEGIHYSVEKATSYSDAKKAAKYGSFNVAVYIMGELKKELNELEACYPIPKDYDQAADKLTRDNYNSQIEQLTQMLDSFDSDGAVYKAMQTKIAELEAERDALMINRIEKYKEDPNYEKIQKYISKIKMWFHGIVKDIIVYSYSNLTRTELRTIIKKFDIHTSAFGTDDSEYGKKFKITKSDLNIMAPIITLDGDGNSALGTVASVSQNSSLVPDQSYSFINPRNVHCKQIYIVNASKSLNTHYMNNKPYYDRMKYKVYSTLISALDQAASELLKKGIGKRIIDTLQSIEEAFYVYGKKLEPYLFNPAAVEYVSYNDMSTLPEPDESSYTTTKSNSKTSTTSSNSTGSAKKPGGNGSVISTNSPYGESSPAVASASDETLDAMSRDDKIAYLAKITGKTTTELADLSDEEINAMIKSENEPYESWNDEVISTLPRSKMESFLLKNGYTQTTLDSKTDDEIRTLVKEVLAKRDYISEMISVMSESSIKTYLKNNGYSEATLSGKTIAELRTLMINVLNKFIIDTSTVPYEYLIYNDRKKYLRTHAGYKELKLYGKSEAYIKKLIANELINNRNFYYPKSFTTYGYDAEGFPILGYPSSDTVAEAISNNEMGSYSTDNKNGYPITSTGYVCPVIGYDKYRKAMYGTPIFYANTTPIATDSRKCAVFSYKKDTTVLDELGESETELISRKTTNLETIEKLETYLANGASGMLKKSYTKQISSLKKENSSIQEILDIVEIKPVIGYDEFGNRVFGETNYLYNIKTVDGVTCVGYDEDGYPIYEIDEEGKPVIGYDSKGNNKYGKTYISPIGKDTNGKIIYGFDTNNKPIYGFTSAGKPVISITYDASGNITAYELSTGSRRRIIGISDDGIPIFEYTITGTPIIGYDADGNGVMYYGIE